MQNRLIVLSIVVFSVLFANAQFENQFELALVGAKDTLPSIVISSKETWINYPKTGRETLIRFMYKPDQQAVLGLTQKDIDNFINNIEPDGTTIQDYECTTWLNGNEVYFNRKAGPGQVHLKGMNRILYTDGNYFVESIPEINKWDISDVDRNPSYVTNVEFFEFESFTPIQMMYYAGDLIQRGAKIDQISALPNDHGYHVTLKDDLLGIVGRFDIDSQKGMLATRSLYLTQRGKSCVQIECEDFQEIVPGFYFPEKIFIIKHIKDFDGNLPSDWLTPDVQTDKLISITITGVTGGTLAQNYIDICIPTKARVKDYRKSVVAKAQNGDIPDGFELSSLHKSSSKRSDSSNTPEFIIGTTTQEYELTNE